MSKLEVWCMNACMAGDRGQSRPPCPVLIRIYQRWPDGAGTTGGLLAVGGWLWESTDYQGA